MRIAWLLFAVLELALTGYFTYAVSWSHRMQVRAHERFEPVRARVLEAELEHVRGGSGSASYHPRVRYEYEVGGCRFESDEFSFLGRGFNDYVEAKALLESYPVGGTVTAWYDPTSPQTAVLDRSYPEGTKYLALGLSVFWAAGIGILLYALWPAVRRKRQEPGAA